MKRSALRYITGATCLTVALVVAGTVQSAAAVSSAPTNATLAAFPAAAKSLGIEARVNYVSIKGGVLEVGLDTPSSDVESALLAALGVKVSTYREATVSSAVLVEKAPDTTKTQSAEATAGTTATVDGFRTNSSPLNDHGSIQAGDRVISSRNGYNYTCTSSGLYTDGTTRFMLTAGHCGQNGTVWSQGYDGINLLTMSPAMGRSWVDGQVDVLGLPLPKVTYDSKYGAQYAYAKSVSQNYKESTGKVGGAWTVDGGYSAALGSKICTDGSKTGWTCSGTVTVTNGCAYIFDDENHNGAIDPGERPYVCGLNQAKGDNGVSLTQPGDSGGPVTSVPNTSNRHVLIAGNISGESNGGNTLYYNDHQAIKAQLGWYLEKDNINLNSGP